jgi:hypothetical protein
VITLNITLDTQVFAKDDFDFLLVDSILLSVTGVVNRQWEEFSAIKAAKQFDLPNVVWEQTWDDTPGSLTFLIGYLSRTKSEIQSCLHKLDGVDQYDIYSLDWPFSEGHGND